MYFDPDTFIEILRPVTSLFETNGAPLVAEDDGAVVRGTQPDSVDDDLSPAILRFLRLIEERAAAELPPSEQPE